MRADSQSSALLSTLVVVPGVDHGCYCLGCHPDLPVLMSIKHRPPKDRVSQHLACHLTRTEGGERALGMLSSSTFPPT